MSFKFRIGREIVWQDSWKKSAAHIHREGCPEGDPRGSKHGTDITMALTGGSGSALLPWQRNAHTSFAFRFALSSRELGEFGRVGETHPSNFDSVAMKPFPAACLVGGGDFSGVRERPLRIVAADELRISEKLWILLGGLLRLCTNAISRCVSRDIARRLPVRPLSFSGDVWPRRSPDGGGRWATASAVSAAGGRWAADTARGRYAYVSVDPSSPTKIRREPTLRTTPWCFPPFRYRDRSELDRLGLAPVRTVENPQRMDRRTPTRNRDGSGSLSL